MGESWLDVRDARGHLLARYDPRRRLIQLKCRRCEGYLSVIDLGLYDIADGEQVLSSGDGVVGGTVHGKAI